MRPEDLDINRIEFTEGGKKVIDWHAEPLEVVYRKLQGLPDGLSEEQVAERLREFGRNTLPTKEPPTLLQVFLHQFASPLIYILLIAGIVALLMQDYKDAVFIFAVLTDESLPWQTWITLFALASVALVVMEIYKAIQKRRALV